MKPPQVREFEQEQLRFLVSKQDVVKLALGNRKMSDVPSPPDGDPRLGMDLAESKYFVGPGEHIKIRTTSKVLSVQGTIEYGFNYEVEFPSGSTGKFNHITIEPFLEKQYNFDSEQIRMFTIFTNANRHVALWPNESVMRSILIIDGDSYFV